MLATTHVPEMIASRYRPIRLIATGGMGAVYEVEHTRTGEHLALKVLLSNVGSSVDAIERFKREQPILHRQAGPPFVDRALRALTGPANAVEESSCTRARPRV